MILRLGWCIWLTLLLATAAYAASDEILYLQTDPRLSANRVSNQVFGAATQPDGKIVVTGVSSGGLVIARFLPNGEVDETFADGGVASLGHVNTTPPLVLPDGKIMIGTSRGLVRFLPEGLLDTTFGQDHSAIWRNRPRPLLPGQPRSRVYQSWKEVRGGLALTRDDRILVIGVNESKQIAVQRLTLDYEPDPHFGDNSVAEIQFQGRVSDFEVLESGKILILGASQPSPRASHVTKQRRSYLIARLLPNGQPDPGFGHNGTVELSDRGTNEMRAFAVLPHGGIVLVGGAGPWSSNPELSDFVVTRFLASGDFDRSFGNDGVISYGILEETPERSIAAHLSTGASSALVDSDGRMTIAGRVATGDQMESIGILRLLSDGSLDRSFGTDGRITTKPMHRHWSQDLVMVKGSGGTTVIAGAAWWRGVGLGCLLRFGDDGIIDDRALSVEQEAPYRLFNFGFVSTERATSAVILDGDRIAVGGSSDYSGSQNMAIAVIDPDGKLDEGFSVDGVFSPIPARIPLTEGRSDLMGRAVVDLVSHPDDILIAAIEYPMGVMAITLDGSLDLTYGVKGSMVFPEDLQYSFEPRSVNIDSQHRVIVAGVFTSTVQNRSGWKYERTDAAIVRLFSNGAIDRRFGRRGMTLGPRKGSSVMMMRGTTVSSSDEIFLVGSSGYDRDSSYAPGPRMTVRAFRKNGKKLRRFGENGQVDVVPSRTNQGWGDAVIKQSDGSLIVAGTWGSALDEQQLTLARLAPDGEIDPAFGTEGRVLADVAGGSFHTTSLVSQENGALVIAGTLVRNNRSHVCVTRYSQNGEIDHEFGDDGSFVLHAGEGSEAVFVGLDSRKRIIVVGSIHSFGNQDFLVVRLNEDGSIDRSFGTNGRVTTDLGHGRRHFRLIE